MTKQFQPGRGYTRSDWEAVHSPELTDEELAKAKPLTEALPELAAAIRRGRGPAKKPTKERVTLRIDRSALDAFRATGDGWQTRISDALTRSAVKLRKP